MSRFDHRLSLVVVGLAILSGCHQADRASAQKPPTPLGGQPSPAVTKAQEADMQIFLGRSAEKRGDLDEAMAAYTDALKRDKHRADAYQRLAVLHDRRGNFQQSAEFYRLALAASPGNPEIYCDMGFSLFLQRRWVEAEQNFRQTIALRPDHARAHNNLGLVLAQNHRDDEALAEYRKAGNDEAQARVNLAVAMTLAGRLGDAREQYLRIVADGSAPPTVRTRLKELDGLIARVADRPTPHDQDDRLIPATSAVALPALPADRIPSGG